MELLAGLTVKTMKIRQMGKLAQSSKKWCAQHITILCCSFIYILLRSVYLWCLQSYTSPEYGNIFTSDHWACYEQLRSKMKVLKIVGIKLESNKHVTITHVLYFFWQLLYKTKSGLRVDRVMSNHYVYACEFCSICCTFYFSFPHSLRASNTYQYAQHTRES